MGAKPYPSWSTEVAWMDATRDELLRSARVTRPARVVGWIQGVHLDDAHKSNLIQSQAAGEIQGARDIQVADTNNSVLGQVVGIQGAGNLQLVNANISVGGRDSHLHTHVHHHEAGADLKAVLDDIDNFRKIQQGTLCKATAGTVEWLFKSQYFSIWWDKTGSFKILWGSGMPGAGKTILTSIAINEIERRAAKSPNSICVAYFYLRYSDHGKLTVRTVLEVLIKQSVERHEGLLPLFEEAYRRHTREGTRPTEEELLGLLHEFTKRTPITVYFLDALDEAPVDIQRDLVEKLASLDAQLFITSRPMQEVQPLFPEAHCFSIVAQEQDLDLHIAKKLSSPRLQNLLAQRDTSFRESVISAIKSKCAGMFLHASLQLAALQKCTNFNSVLQTLERFPVKIEEVYHQTWERVINQGPEQSTPARAALAWVLYAKRSLTIEELRHATATHPDTHVFEEDCLIPPSTIIDLCHGLLTVDEESRLVRLVHYTAKQPLEQLLTSLLPRPQSLLASVCTTHLMSCGFQDTTITSMRELEKALKSDPLLRYAYEFWPDHVHNSFDIHLTDTGISTFIAGCRAFPVKVPGFHSQQLCLELLGPFHITAFYDLPIHLVGPHGGHSINTPTKIRRSAPLALASVRGHYAAVQDFLYLPDLLVNALDSDGLTALMNAAWRGCERTVNLLLTHPDIDINLANDSGVTALMIASKNGRESVVKLLLAHPGVQVNLTDKKGCTALIHAIWWGRESTVKLLLTHPDISVNPADESVPTALMKAFEHDIQNIVELLLSDSRIEVNLASIIGVTRGWRRYSCLKRLLIHPGINVNSTNKNGDAALMLASADTDSYFENIMMLLLAHPDIEVNLANNNGDTALMLCQSTDRLKLLLDHPRTNVNLTNKRGETALMLRSQDGSEDIVKLILAHPTTQVNLANKDGDTSLILASKDGCEDTTKLLLAHPDIRVNLANGRGFTALMAACDNRRDAIVRLLLAHPRTQVNLANNDGDTPLMLALREGHMYIAQLIVVHPSTQVNLANKAGQTALMLASQKGDAHTILHILAHPSTQVNLANNEGDTPLILASKYGLKYATKLLLAHPDIRVNLANGRGFTALMAACDNRHDAIVKLLLAHPDIDRNLTDNTGLTALMYACRRCIEDIAQRPLALQH